MGFGAGSAIIEISDMSGGFSVAPPQKIKWQISQQTTIYMDDIWTVPNDRWLWVKTPVSKRYPKSCRWFMAVSSPSHMGNFIGNLTPPHGFPWNIPHGTLFGSLMAWAIPSVWDYQIRLAAVWVSSLCSLLVNGTSDVCFLHTLKSSSFTDYIPMYFSRALMTQQWFGWN